MLVYAGLRDLTLRYVRVGQTHLVDLSVMRNLTRYGLFVCTSRHSLHEALISSMHAMASDGP